MKNNSANSSKIHHQECFRVGVVDIGSNSVRFVVFDGAARSPGYFYNEKIMCQLGADISHTGRLNPEGRKRALHAIHRFQLLAKRMNIGKLTAVATAAIRESQDGNDFCQQILQETGLAIKIIDGQQEARLSAQGVLLGWPGSYGLVSDIGGSSMELAEIRNGEIGKCITSALGPLKLAGLDSNNKKKIRHIRETLYKMHKKLGPQKDRLFLVGGSWRAIARIDMSRRNYPLHVLHEYRMTRETVTKTLDFIARTTPEDLRNLCVISSARMAMVPDAALVLREMVDIFQPYDIAISGYGLREGLLYEHMPPELRDCDPLIEACRFSEQKDARVPGFGTILYGFIKGLFPDKPAEVLRIIRAACLLHDVSWRAHPDYRSEVCFDNATRANLGGLTHSERVFLGLALMNRYSQKYASDRFDDIAGLLPRDDQILAEIVGRAMRFGAMLWIDTRDGPGHLRWKPKTKTLQINLSRETYPLFGEVAQSRMNALAQSLGARSVNIQVT